MKTCKKCNTSKPETDFYRANGGTSLFPECKPCNRERAKAWVRNKRASDPGYDRRVSLKSLYGITPEQYESMLARQGGRCAICTAHTPRGRGKRFHVDHDHVTGVIRGLLCHACNTGIGALGEDPERISSALAYILRQKDSLGAVTF
jgi:hypothetical protein